MAPGRAFRVGGRGLTLSPVRDICLARGPRYTLGMPRGGRTLGLEAEALAARTLTDAGLVVVARNVRFPEGELDLVCRDGRTWVFVEVKCRRAAWGDDPAAAISWRKQRRISRLAQHYLKWRRLGAVRCRFDVVSVVLGADGTPRVRHVPSAFEAIGW